MNTHRVPFPNDFSLHCKEPWEALLLPQEHQSRETCLGPWKAAAAATSLQALMTPSLIFVTKALSELRHETGSPQQSKGMNARNLH